MDVKQELKLLRKEDIDIKSLENALVHFDNLSFFDIVRTLDEANSLVPTFDRIIRTLHGKIIQFKEEPYTGYAANLKIGRYSGAWYTLEELGKKLRQSLQSRFIEGVKKYHGQLNEDQLECLWIKQAIERIYRDAFGYVSSEAVKKGTSKREVKGNLYEELIRLREMGIDPLGIKVIDDWYNPNGTIGYNKFVIQLPITLDGKKMMGIYIPEDEKIFTFYPIEQIPNADWVSKIVLQLLEIGKGAKLLNRDIDDPYISSYDHEGFGVIGKREGIRMDTMVYK
ncbi:MAG: hypothetical protein NTW30_02505 [Candidatus Aenigmarchaeota archaeon]|nr:hypothetical protein [Candidatus Aenigmarchaeota archaeon]